MNLKSSENNLFTAVAQVRFREEECSPESKSHLKIAIEINMKAVGFVSIAAPLERRKILKRFYFLWQTNYR